MKDLRCLVMWHKYVEKHSPDGTACISNAADAGRSRTDPMGERPWVTALRSVRAAARQRPHLPLMVRGSADERMHRPRRRWVFAAQ